MDKNFFSIQKELREVCKDKSLSDAINTFLSNEEGMLCIDPYKVCISYGECRNVPTGTYYFFQNYDSQEGILEKYWYRMDVDKPFLVIETKPLPVGCPLQPGRHLVYLCDPRSDR